MIERIVNIGFSRRGVVWLVFCFAALYGVFSWKQLPLEAYPDIADVTSQIAGRPLDDELDRWLRGEALRFRVSREYARGRG